MKRKGFFILATMAILMASQASAQTFTEIFTDGWGQGRRFIRPCFTDLDNDGLLDLLLGEHSVGIQHLEQVAAGSTQFSPVTTYFSGIDAGSRPTPTITDLDNDALLDLIIGKENGTISHYEQDSPGSTDFSLVSESFSDIDVKRYATPRFIDLDQDGLLDLIVGMENGTLNHYKQDAAGSTEFSLVTDTFNMIDVGYLSVPCFTDLDGDGLIDMIVGVNAGHMHHYEQASLGSTDFDLVSEKFNGMDIGAQACPVFTDVDQDGLQDLMIGDNFGFLHFYEQEASGSENMQLISGNILPGMDIGIHASPSFVDLDHDGLLDMIVGETNGKFFHFKQDAEGSTLFNFLADTLWGIDVGSFPMPVFVDLDGNGLLDMLVGNNNGNLFYYEQETYGSLDFILVTKEFNSIDVGDECAPAIMDLNADGLLDLIIGVADGTLSYYVQDAIQSTGFSLVTTNFSGIDLNYVARPCFTDLGDDGLIDMIIGDSDDRLFHYRQSNVGSLEFTLVSDNFLGITTDTYSAPVFADINGDGLEDLFVGCYNGGIRYFQASDNTGYEQQQPDPSSFITFSVYPNPVHGSAQIQYSLQRPANVQITIYSILGEEIRLLENSFNVSGSHTIHWDGTDEHGQALAEGSYICSIQAGGIRKLIKIMIVK